jgi:hypothetical protein
MFPDSFQDRNFARSSYSTRVFFRIRGCESQALLHTIISAISRISKTFKIIVTLKRSKKIMIAGLILDLHTVTSRNIR